MSSNCPSAFDVLMSNPSKMRKKPSRSLPRKRKAPTENSQALNSKPNGNRLQDLLVNGVETSYSDAIDEKLPGSKDKGKFGSVLIEDQREKWKDSTLAPKDSKVLISPDESVVELKKTASRFDVSKAVYWGKGEKVPFMFVAKAFDAISMESGRTAKTEIACNMLRAVIDSSPDDLLAIVYFLANKVAPAHEGLELGIGDPLIITALAEAFGTNEVRIKEQSKELGDLGLVAKSRRSSQPLMHKPEPLTVAKVFDTFQLIAKESGQDSRVKKKNHIKALLVAATDCEPQYLIRLLQRNLRIDQAGQTLLTALGHATVYSEKRSSPPKEVDNPLAEAEKIVKQVYSVTPVDDKIVPALLSGGVWNLPKTCRFSPGIPMGVMLAKQTKAVSEIVEKFQDMEFTCEYKYDGQHAQIHYMEDGTVEIFSRNAERTTGMFPDVVSAITRLKKPSVASFVLDCELVAYDREKQKILPLQILSTRARKNVVLNKIKVDVCIFAFDILYLNGQLLLQEQLNIRREHLYESFQEECGFLQFVTAITSNDLEEIHKFFDDSVNASCEGLIIKTLNKDATYEPSIRSHNWLKLKKDYIEGLGDSLDLVPIAAFHGKGKRTGVYGTFLLACYDDDKEEFQSICKIGTGFSKAKLKECSTSLRSKVIPKPSSYYRYSDTLSPDVWFEASEVWEVKAAGFTKSRVYGTGIVAPDKGISLRFPRLIRVREDKNPEDASSADMVN